MIVCGEIMRYPVLCVLALCTAPAAIHAQSIIPSLDEPGHKGDMARMAWKRSVARFDGTDADKDGRLAREEVARQSRYLTDNFDRLDTSKDGYLSWGEFVGHDRWPK